MITYLSGRAGIAEGIFILIEEEQDPAGQVRLVYQERVSGQWQRAVRPDWTREEEAQYVTEVRRLGRDEFERVRRTLARRELPRDGGVDVLLVGDAAASREFTGFALAKLG
jgi:hypothetical protein